MGRLERLLVRSQKSHLPAAAGDCQNDNNYKSTLGLDGSGSTPVPGNGRSLGAEIPGFISFRPRRVIRKQRPQALALTGHNLIETIAYTTSKSTWS